MTFSGIVAHIWNMLTVRRLVRRSHAEPLSQLALLLPASVFLHMQRGAGS